MKILTALTYYRPHYSGLTIYAERLARALAQRGHHVTVLTSRYNKDLSAHEVQDGVEIYRSRVLMHISKGVLMPAMALQAWKLLKQADVVQLHLPQLDAAPIALMARLQHKPVILTYHCDLVLPHGIVHWLANQVSHFANRISASQAQKIVQNSRDYAEHSIFLKRYPSKLYPIYPPVEIADVSPQELEAFKGKAGIRPGEEIIGIVARLATEKGVEYLAEALPTILNSHPQARVLFVGPHQNIIGEEAYARRLEPLLSSLGKHREFLGILSDHEKTAFFRSCNLTVTTSINSTESFGLVQVESMMCGTPVVVTDLPGIRVPVRQTRKGLLVPPGNAQALAQAIIQVLDHPEAYRGSPNELLEASRPASVAEEYETLFHLVMNSSATSRDKPR